MKNKRIVLMTTLVLLVCITCTVFLTSCACGPYKKLVKYLKENYEGDTPSAYLGENFYLTYNSAKVLEIEYKGYPCHASISLNEEFDGDYMILLYFDSYIVLGTVKAESGVEFDYDLNSTVPISIYVEMCDLGRSITSLALMLLEDFLVKTDVTMADLGFK